MRLSEYVGFQAAVPEMVPGLMLPILPLICFGLQRAASSVRQESDRSAVVEPRIGGDLLLDELDDALSHLRWGRTW